MLENLLLEFIEEPVYLTLLTVGKRLLVVSLPSDDVSLRLLGLILLVRNDAVDVSASRE